MEEKTIDAKNIGLRGVKVADTRISDVDGEKGILIYRGFNICDLVAHSTFEEVSFLLLNDRLPTGKDLKGFQKILVSEREYSFGRFCIDEEITVIRPPHGCAPGLHSRFGEL